MPAITAGSASRCEPRLVGRGVPAEHVGERGRGGRGVLDQAGCRRHAPAPLPTGAKSGHAGELDRPELLGRPASSVTSRSSAVATRSAVPSGGPYSRADLAVDLAEAAGGDTSVDGSEAADAVERRRARTPRSRRRTVPMNSRSPRRSSASADGARDRRRRRRGAGQRGRTTRSSDAGHDVDPVAGSAVRQSPGLAARLDQPRRRPGRPARSSR